ncbi:LacI family DNA-binding transcriptional regulator [Ktedonobacter robiniae]|uniref:LacI family transcriptional regulator n=1 Tax=Ktedonobacter robiniae TaxID=2778365 RepID=A0ABQ3UPB2_9CHLR|nr:LacI family DNA-binding transcriptional regulator [Ktedonobacter robiniae]GHO54511.1 LacI family transcriptional regulator [Ktedonobacter robiniae]
MEKRNVTLKDVARKAGVSTATVARVLHDQGYIAEETRKQVEAAIRETGYRINVVAQGLRKQQTLTIGHILHSIMPNPFYAGVALGVEQEAMKHGWSVLMINVQGDARRERLGVETLIQRRVDAILFTSAVDETNVRLALDAGLQVVQVQQPTAIPTHQVTVDNYVGSAAAVEHLISLGHRRIAYIGAGPTYVHQDPAFVECLKSVEGERFSGYRDTLQKYQIPVDEQLIAFGRYYTLEHDNNSGDGYTYTRQFLQLDRRPTAIFATCDILATGALQAIYECSLRVPDDISIIGFDNTYAPYLTPPLTTVELPMTDIGKAAVRIVLEQGQQDTSTSWVQHQVRLSTRLVVRSSTGVAPSEHAPTTQIVPTTNMKKE